MFREYFRVLEIVCMTKSFRIETCKSPHQNINILQRREKRDTKHIVIIKLSLTIWQRHPVHLTNYILN